MQHKHAELSLAYAQQLDSEDPLASYRQQFHIPQLQTKEAVYLCGNSLGLQPKRTASYVQQALEDWAQLGVAGHTQAEYPWLPYHEFVTDGLAKLVGALPQEVVAMNGLSVNLHLLLVSFYQPTPTRYKIIIEQGAFPSDHYVVASQLAFHGFDPTQGIIELAPRPGELTLRTADIEAAIAQHGAETALILLGGVNYLTGQAFDLAAITRAGHAQGVIVGFDLAHAVGNVVLQLHEWQVDFAAWCCYKYLNAGPGAIAGCFIHDKHVRRTELPRFCGWWGHDKPSRFLMPKTFKPILTAEAWQLSNPPILQLAALRASLEDFTTIGMVALRQKSQQLTAYLADLIAAKLTNIQVITPSNYADRGSQLSLVLPTLDKPVEFLQAQGIVCDFREPNVLRVAPTALYNRYQDVYTFVAVMQQWLKGE